MQVKSNTDGAFVNKKWVKTAFLILGTILTVMGLTQIFCLIFKPTGYEKIIRLLGNKYWQQLLLGILFLLSYFLSRKSSFKNSK